MKINQASFTAKIIWLVALTAAVTGMASFISAYYFLSQGFDAQAEREIAHTSTIVQNAANDLMERTKKNVVSFSARPDLTEGVEKKDGAYLQQIAKRFMANNGLSILTIADKDGIVITRGHSDKAGDSVANQDNVKKAMAAK